MKLILIGHQQPDRVLELLLRFDPVIEVTGKASPRPVKKQLSPRAVQFYVAVLAAILFGFAVAFGYCAMMGIGGGRRKTAGITGCALAAAASWAEMMWSSIIRSST